VNTVSQDQSDRWGLAPSLDEFAALAEQAFESLPEGFRRLTGAILFRVDEFATDEVLTSLGIENPFDLTGLYSGVDLGLRSVMDPVLEPSRVFLYRRPILDEWTERGDVTLLDLITHVLVHEIGHHFGLSDEAMEAIEAGLDGPEPATYLA
jgi:predicted Zn-dependent protease with MMP-like domain